MLVPQDRDTFKLYPQGITGAIIFSDCQYVLHYLLKTRTIFNLAINAIRHNKIHIITAQFFIISLGLISSLWLRDARRSVSPEMVAQHYLLANTVHSGHPQNNSHLEKFAVERLREQ